MNADLHPLDSLYPALAALPPALRREFDAQTHPVHVPAGSVVFDAGMACQALPLVLAGSIRVSKRADNGREIRLYGVGPGELCLVTIGCLLGNDAYPATGVVEADVSALILPRALFSRLVHEQASFREAVFSLYAARLAELMQLVEEVAFRKLDQRLAGWLVLRGPVIASSHQGVADELGSAREIVSRLLKQFEESGWLCLGRERIEVLLPAELERLARA